MRPILFLLLTLAACSQVVEKTGGGVVYVNITSHNEENAPPDPNYLVCAGVTGYNVFREFVREMAETVKSKGGKWNFQSDHKFLRGTALCDNANLTNGKNIIRWLKEDMGFEIDPHAHEGQGYTYPDVAKLTEDLGVTPSGTVGGFIYDDPRWESLQVAELGSTFPSYSWSAERLWGGGSLSHTADLNAYGIWKPQDAENFTTHKADNHLVIVGGGCANVVEASTSVSEVVGKITAIVDGIRSGAYPADGFYTANIMLNVRDFDESGYIQKVGEIIEGLAPYVADGSVAWKTIAEKHALWVDSYQSTAFRLDCPL